MVRKNDGIKTMGILLRVNKSNIIVKYAVILVIAITYVFSKYNIKISKKNSETVKESKIQNYENLTSYEIERILEELDKRT
jgi:hypothetical protein